jgi:molybdate transport system substrate-binding protein
MRLLLIFFLSGVIFAKSINIAVAANVSYAIKELIKEFNKNSNQKINVIIGSSGKLSAQIENGAPYSLFLSANVKYPKYLYEQNITKNKPIIYAKGSLVLATTKDINLTSINDVLREDLKKIAIANPKTAPYGTAAKEALINSKLFKKIKSKLIVAQSVGQSLIYTLKATDAGFIAKSALFAPKLKGKLNYVDIDKSLYKDINQAMILLKDDAKDFYNFLQSKKAKEILKNYGYIVN